MSDTKSLAHSIIQSVSDASVDLRKELSSALTSGMLRNFEDLQTICHLLGESEAGILPEGYGNFPDDLKLIQGTGLSIYHGLLDLSKGISNFSKYGSNYTVNLIVSIVIHDILDDAPPEILNKLYEKAKEKATDTALRAAAKYAEKEAVIFLIVQSISLPIIKEFSLLGLFGLTSPQKALRKVVGGALTELFVQDFFEKASDASKRLHSTNPEIWYKLRLHGYDMLFFLMEKPLTPWLVADRLHRNNPDKWDEVLHEIDHLLH